MLMFTIKIPLLQINFNYILEFLLIGLAIVLIKTAW